MLVGSPEISIVIPTYTRPVETRRAVNSALAQDVDLEVIVVDDASPQAFSYRDSPRVKVVRLERNAGPSAARNRGVYEARGRWIALLDSDDAWPAESLKPRLAAARDADDGEARTIWASGFVYVSPEGVRGEKRIPRASASPLDFASGCWMCPGSTALMRRAAWDRSAGQDERLRRLEDYEWMLRWGLSGGRLRVYDSVGAEITRRSYTQSIQIEAAAAYIRGKHVDASPMIQRRIKSYLQLEIAATCLRKHSYINGFAALAQSWLHRPRLRVALEPFWTA